MEIIIARISKIGIIEIVEVDFCADSTNTMFHLLQIRINY